MWPIYEPITIIGVIGLSQESIWIPEGIIGSHLSSHTLIQAYPLSLLLLLLRSICRVPRADRVLHPLWASQVWGNMVLRDGSSASNQGQVVAPPPVFLTVS